MIEKTGLVVANARAKNLNKFYNQINFPFVDVFAMLINACNCECNFYLPNTRAHESSINNRLGLRFSAKHRTHVNLQSLAQKFIANDMYINHKLKNLGAFILRWLRSFCVFCVVRSLCTFNLLLFATI